jgi:hypothetical protein
MPTRPTKGDHGHADSGSREAGNQKATYGSTVSPEVAEGQREAATAAGEDEEEATS